MASLRLHTGARSDYEEASNWYADRSLRAAERFEAAVQQVLDQIRATPESFPVWEEDERHRYAIVKRFPFVVFYRVIGEMINVLAIQHAKRDPAYWRHRIE